MIINNSYLLFAILVTLGLLRFSLSKSTFNRLISVLFRCCLFFYVSETFLSFLPVVSYLLKDYIQHSFVFLKTMFSDLTGRPGKDYILDGTKHLKVSQPEEPQHVEQVLTTQEKESFLTQKGFLPSPSESPSSDMGKQGKEDHSFIEKEEVSVLQEKFADSVTSIFAILLVGKFVQYSLNHLTKYRHTPEHRKYATRNVIVMGLLVLLAVVLLKEFRI